jgi:putative membrane protein
MRTQVQAHTAALKLQQDYSSFGANPALKAIATQLVPIIKRHLDQAQTILDRLAKA